MINNERAARYATEGWRTGARRNREAHADGKIHVSTLDECPRQIQWRFQGVKPSDPYSERLNLRAQFGTALHTYFLTLWAEQYRTDPEVDEVLIDDESRGTEVQIGPVVAHPDMVVVYKDGTCEVFELKFGDKALVDQANSDAGPKRSHRDQCRAAAAIIEAQSGMPVRGYYLYTIDMARPRQNWSMVPVAWTEAEQEAGVARVQYATSLADPEAPAPRWFGRHDGDAFRPNSPCLGCEFRTRCLGKDADDPARAEAAAQLVHAGHRYKEEIRHAQDELLEFLKLKAGIEKPQRYKDYTTTVIAHLGLEPGQYELDGTTRGLRWREGYDQFDAAAGKQRLLDLGVDENDLPKTRVAGHFRFE